MERDKRPPPKDLSHHFSRSAQLRQPSSIKKFYKYFQIPGIGQLAGGLPNNYYFPYDTLEANVARPDRWQPTPNRPIDPPIAESIVTNSSPLNQPQDHVQVPHTSKQVVPTKKIDLATALQYGQATGYPPLWDFISQFTKKHMHPNCPYAPLEVILTCGNTDGFSKVLQTFTNEWFEGRDDPKEREGLLCEEFAYMNAIQAARPRGLNVMPVKIDDEGMLADGPGGLKDVLENWDHSKGKIPQMIYTVTMGQNPTSGVLSLQRRRDIYALCQKYDILIVEDDPYWYLQFPSATSMNTTTTHDSTNTSFNPEVDMFINGEPKPEGWKSSGYKFLDSLVPSSISIDTDGRVIRLDTFSKTIAPGCRLGYITAQWTFTERILRVTETSTQQPSGFVQSLVSELLLGPDQVDHTKSLPANEAWNADGWIRWVEGLRGNYERRMNKMCSVLEDGKYALKSGRRPSMDNSNEWSVVEKVQVYSFDWPVGGMFVWLKVHFEDHPLWREYKNEPERLSQALWYFWTTEPWRVLVSPGTIFSPSDEIREQDGWRFFRLCFAAIDEEDLEPVSQRLGECVRHFWRIKDKKIIEDLLAEQDFEEAVCPIMNAHRKYCNIADTMF